MSLWSLLSYLSASARTSDVAEWWKIMLLVKPGECLAGLLLTSLTLDSILVPGFSNGEKTSDDE